MKCTNCGAELEEGVLFCRECGTKVIPQKRFCRECGAQISDDVKFCPQCGAKIEFPQFNAQTQQGVYENGEPSYKIKKASVTQASETTAKIANFGRQMKQTVQSSFDANKNNSKKNSSNKKIPAIIAAVILVILAISLLFGKGGSSGDSSNKSEKASTNVLTANNTFDPIVPEVSDTATIEPGVEYAYMADAWNVYIAKAVSDNVIKVESWHKSSQSDKTLKYRADLGSFRIRDEENGFSWIDDAHTAFTLTIQDKNNSEVKKPTSVVFTININDSDRYKGTDYDDKIACYSYANDDWHTYRAIALTDRLVKIECWYRTSSGFLSSHCFGWDVGVIDTENTNTDFEWGDSDHKAFTITMKDPANSSYWKEEKLTSFILENEKYKYPTVMSFLGKDDSTQSANQESRVQRDGFNSATNEIYYFSQYSVEIPSYWTNEQKINEGIQRYAETGDKVAMLQIVADYDTDEDYPVTFDGLMSDIDNMQKVVEDSVFSEVTSREVIDTGYVKGVLFRGRSTNFQNTGLDVSGEWFTYASEKDRYWCNLISAQSDNTEYLYDDDFMKIINSIRPVDGGTEKEETSNAQEATTAHEETTTSVAETTPPVTEAEVVETKNQMPVMEGTSLADAVEKAKEFGLKESYDEDFGHGTRCKSLSDSAGGLTLDIIYSSSTKEILSGSIVTFNTLASASSQKEFIKGMAGVLCPTSDINAVTSWVSSNVGTAKETEINGEIYEVGLGPVGNLLYYAGERNWEDWELAQ